MVLVLGTDSGFVTTAPTGTPVAGSLTFDDKSVAMKDTSPVGSIKITEIGWYCPSSTPDVNFEVGLYNSTGTLPNSRLFVDNTNAKGTGSGWKRVTVDWSISASTVYWIAAQLDNTSTTVMLFNTTVGNGLSRKNSQTSLPSPWGSSDFTDNVGYAGIYALVEVEAPAGTNTQINIGDAWKEIAGIQINIGDAWKAVAGMQVNIGDAWKTIF